MPCVASRAADAPSRFSVVAVSFVGVAGSWGNSHSINSSADRATVSQHEHWLSVVGAVVHTPQLLKTSGLTNNSVAI